MGEQRRRWPAESPITAADLDDIRAQLPAVASGVAYLNAGTLGPVPRVAADAMRRELEADVTVRQTAQLWERLAGLQDDARSALGTLTGVAPEQVALMHTTHEAINTCLWGLELGAGSSLVITDEEHPGVIVPTRHVAARTGCHVRVAPVGADDEATVSSIAAAVDPSTRALVISHVSWVSGRIFPLTALRAAIPPTCRIIVDGAQSAGVLTTDPTDGWDAYTVSGQKWPCGPNGSGGLALVDPEGWLPTFGAALQVTDLAHADTSPIRADGRRFETSQEAPVPLAGLAASVGWLVREVGLSRAHAHAQWCNGVARQALAPVCGPETLHGDDHLLCIDVPDETAGDIASQLMAQGVLVRALGAARVRASFGCWTSADDVQRFAAALSGCLDRAG